MDIADAARFPALEPGSRAMDAASVGERAMTGGLAWSPEIRVMLAPWRAWPRLAALPDGRGRWTAFRRPLVFALLLGAMVSLVASRTLALRLVADGAINASFVLAVEIGALWAVWRSSRTVPFARAVDLFFMGYGPWWLWILGYTVVWSFTSPVQAFIWTTRPADGIRWRWRCCGAPRLTSSISASCSGGVRGTRRATWCCNG